MTVEQYTAVIDTCILVQLLIWSYLDRKQIYFGNKE